MNPLTQVKDYQSMLNRIFVCTSVTATFCTWLLRNHSEAINNNLSWLDITVELWGIKGVKIFGYLLPGIVVGLIARTIRLHDRISDVLGIRARFDIDRIILPMAEGVGFPIGNLNLETLRNNRDRLMQKIFYRYTSSTQPKIDTHFIYEALDWWSWYWVQLEAVVIIVPVGFAMLFVYSRSYGGILLGISAVALFVTMPFFRHHCGGYARHQVDEIVSDKQRVAEIRGEFDAL